MINLKIPLGTALALLTERMRYELKFRQKAGLAPDKINLSDLNYEELLTIVETAAFDLVSFLPYELLTQNNNLIDIITKSINSLAQLFSKNEFGSYSRERCKRLFGRLMKVYREEERSKSFLYN
ncbi:hypothetical protein BMS3Abin04_00353 [bacterium BMS3Abin04]|nr:hypothetical protein BMS3Abin04_00353 [bacterium BMS3Abin04]